jgi:hypothetical protein
MSSEKLYSEILEEFTNAPTKEEKLHVLRRNDDPRFRFFLELVFNPNVEWDIELPHMYRPAVEPAGLNYAYLDTEMPKMYRFIKDHPNSRNGGLIAEHRLVMAEHLGRPLVKGENVHHINGNKVDNRIENLEVWNTTQPAGQRPEDKVAYAIQILELYAPELLVKVGV